MIKNIVQISEKINDRDFNFLCESDAPTADIKEFCCRVLKYVGNIEDQARANQEAEQAKEAIVEEEIPVSEPQLE